MHTRQYDAREPHLIEALIVILGQSGTMAPAGASSRRAVCITTQICVVPVKSLQLREIFQHPAFPTREIAGKQAIICNPIPFDFSLQ